MVVAGRRMVSWVGLLACAGAVACDPRPAVEGPLVTQSAFSDEIRNGAVDSVDLLLEVDNSGSMRENQARLVAQFVPMIERLTSPPDDNADGRPDYPPVASLHVGVISSDLGTPGASVRGCDNADVGDDGLLNPIRNGLAMQRHEPWTAAPAGFRPTDCVTADQFPAFIAFNSAAGTDAATFSHDVVCNAALYIGGCGFEQQLEAVRRALVSHRADDAPGNTDPNAGFLRQNAILSIVVISDEDDGSVRDCRYAEPGVPCTDGTAVFRAGAAAFDDATLSLASASGPSDPRWPLERYVDPRDPSRGFPGVKPGHPELVFFAAITGVPVSLPASGGPSGVDWDALLGAPGAGGPEDFAGRDRATALAETLPEGPVSMRGEPDPSCTGRALPACRRPGTGYDPATPPCAPTEQYFGHPARRLVEIARRFDQSPLCNGAPCGNGAVLSVCGDDFGRALEPVARRLHAAPNRCLPRVLPTSADAEGNRTVRCEVRESLPAGRSCDPALGRIAQLDPAGVVRLDPETMGPICAVAQLATDVSGEPVPTVTSPAGWYYDAPRDPGEMVCRQRVAFTALGAPPFGSITRFECIQSVTGS